MRQPYENIYLGNFILTLGYLAGKRDVELNQTVLQLLQQTPDDRTVGDLFANLGGRNFIFEFKRNELQVKSEFSKHQRTELLATLHSPDSEKILALSRQCHYMCFPVRTVITTLSFMPYALIQDNKYQDPRNSVDLTSFCTSLLDSLPGLGVSYELFLQYLDVLVRFTDGDPPGDGGAGAIMNISEKGEISVIEVDNLRVLARTLDHEPEPPTRTLSRRF